MTERMVLRKLARPPVLGMNHRNIHIIAKYNAQNAIRLVNDKHALKGVLARKKIPVSASIEKFTSLIGFEKGLPRLKPPFVIKPGNGSAGRGIIIMKGADVSGGTCFFDVSGKKWSCEDLGMHALNILNGEYSVGAVRDYVLVEALVEPSAFFRKLSQKGLSDIRVIVFLGVPLAAMVRIPTKESGWRANISQGALAAGVDVKTGKLISLYSKKEKYRLTEPLPGKYRDLKIPDWDRIIDISLKASKESGLGYCGVDVVVSENGPLIMECNARPGLEIQNVTGISLLSEKELIETSLARAGKIPKYAQVLHGIEQFLEKHVFGGRAGK